MRQQGLQSMRGRANQYTPVEGRKFPPPAVPAHYPPLNAGAAAHVRHGAGYPQEWANGASAPKKGIPVGDVHVSDYHLI